MSAQTATLAGGCFWCLEAAFTRVPGVLGVESGYTGGQAENPTYEQVCTGRTGHAEAVRITFAGDVVSYRDLLGLFFALHDPTTLNRQGGDVGTQYRSAIFPADPEQERIARETVAALTAERVFPDPIVTEILPPGEWYPAEAYHRDYYERHPEQAYCQVVIAPKLARLRKLLEP
ncbi:MAG: peptide-methionine (S)-S-oxide reductase MsrA [Gemmatimonadetes bacterium]|nr:peptide-methionine (S)-S-oxide reductase MsrA [Gemmatimonadota bacterium]